MSTTLTGRHVALIFGGAFSVIIGVNVALAVSAVRTFPGVETRNSYVASQSFDADRRAQEALGWTVRARVEGAALHLAFSTETGPVWPEIEGATLGRATHVGEDRAPVFEIAGDGYVADVGELAPGNWNLRLAARASDGTPFRQRIVIRVAP